MATVAEPTCNEQAQRGASAERAAEQWLASRGLQTLARNYRCRRGEIDLVMRDGSGIVFVEVRRRSRSDFGGASASVDIAKQRRLIVAAQHFLLSHPQLQNAPCRFDVLAARREDEWQWLRDAFQISC